MPNTYKSVQQTPIGTMYYLPLTDKAKIDRLTRAIDSLTSAQRITRAEKRDMAEVLHSIRMDIGNRGLAPFSGV